ncbi:MAG: hypothetical protein H0X17_23055, partial [Deltaproteobacteria bacterium]|nr:hypothetical protein [Deltaproteobacteria bacterium]
MPAVVDSPADRIASPGIIMVACGTQASALVLPPAVALGRRIVAAAA